MQHNTMHDEPTTTQRPRILCLDADKYLSELLEYVLSQEGFAAQCAVTAAEALQLAEDDRPDLVLIDCDLEDTDSFELCAHFRTVLKVPVILLSSQQSDEAAITGFGHGADDFVSKPFSLRVLVHRIRAVLRRAQATSPIVVRNRTNYRVGPALFNSAYNELTYEGTCAKFTPTEGKILQLLLSAEGQVLPAERIMARVQSFDAQSDVTVIKAHVRNVRIKISRVLGTVPVIRLD